MENHSPVLGRPSGPGRRISWELNFKDPGDTHSAPPADSWWVAGGGQSQKIPGRDGKTLGGFRNQSWPTGQQVSHQYGEQPRQSGNFPHPHRQYREEDIPILGLKLKRHLMPRCLFMENRMQSLERQTGVSDNLANGICGTWTNST